MGQVITSSRASASPLSRSPSLAMSPQRAPPVLGEAGRGLGELQPVLGELEPALPSTSGHSPWTEVRPGLGVLAAQPVPFFQIVIFYKSTAQPSL